MIEALGHLAGVARAKESGLIDTGESVLVLATGNGLKDVSGAMRAVEAPSPIQPNLGEVRRAIAVA